MKYIDFNRIIRNIESIDTVISDDYFKNPNELSYIKIQFRDGFVMETKPFDKAYEKDVLDGVLEKLRNQSVIKMNEFNDMIDDLTEEKDYDR